MKGFAAFCGSLRVLRYMIINNVDIDRSTIWRSVIGGDEQMIGFLSEQGHSFDNQLEHAVRCHHNKIGFWLMENYKCEEIDLPFCVYFFNTEMFLHFLIDRERNINETDWAGRTSVIYASQLNNIPIAEFLVSKEETEIRLEDDYGKTAIDFAITKEMREILTKSQSTRITLMVNSKRKMIYSR